MVGYKKIVNKIVEFENRHRGRELPGFVNYKTFENLVREQLRTLEEPALDMLHAVTSESLLSLLGQWGPSELSPGVFSNTKSLLTWK